MNLSTDLAKVNEHGIQPRPYHRTRKRFYYSQMVDWLVANPGGTQNDLAKFVNKSVGTVSAIVRSDMFQAALRQRQEEFSKQQDLLLHNKITKVAVASLDTILSVIETKRGSIPLETLNDVADGALKRLGYGVESKQPAVQVNVQTNNNVAAPVSIDELNDARALMKHHQQQLAGTPQPSLPSPPERSSGGASPSIGDFIDVPSKEVALVNGSGEG